MSLFGHKKDYLAIKRELFSHKKDGNLAICDNMDKPWEYNGKWNKPGKGKCCMISFTCEFLRKWTQK